MLGKNVVYTLTQESNMEYLHERIDENFFKKHVSDFNKNFYVCGPDVMVQEITNTLLKLGAIPDTVIFEK
jgi:Na+-transporting NADH:ubiquinone oxidoreductase subunit NqrF